MLAHVASLMPWGNVAMRVNFASAIFGALAAGVLTLVVVELVMTAPFVPGLRRSQAKKNPRQERGARSSISEETDGGLDRSWLLVFTPAIGAGLLISFSRTLWSYSTIAEVYSLNTLLILTVLFLMVRWRRSVLIEKRRVASAGTPNFSYGLLYAGAVLFGLALGVHHVTVALILPALAFLVYRTAGLKFFASTSLLWAALFSLTALLAVYAYLPLAASRAPVINWGDPRSIQEIWWHITGRQYQVFFSFSLREMWGQFVEFLGMVLRELGSPWLPTGLLLAIAGFWNLFRRDRTTFWFLLLILGADLIYALGYSIAEDKDAYYLPAFVSLGIATGFGVRWLIQKILSKSWPIERTWLATASVVLLVAAISLASNWPFNNRRNFFIARDYVENILSTIEPNGLLLTADWQVASPLFYVQEIEGRRRDVKVVDVKLLHRSWYFDYLKRAYPDLIERSRDKVEAYLADLIAWDRDPQAFANDWSLTRRINLSFQEMVHSMVLNENKIAPVYVTGDLPFADRREPELTKWLNQSFQLVAQGLVFKLESDQTFHDSPDVKLQLRGLADGAIHFEKDDVVSLKILPVYTSMFVNRGRYLALHNQHERAIAAFKEALVINPNYELAQQGLQESTRKLQNP